MSDEQAKAVQEVAKTTGDIVKAAGGLGSYLARVFGSIPDNLLGLVVGDWLEHKRRRHLRLLEVNTARLLEDDVGSERITEPNPAILIPLLQSAADESEPELQAMWAALLANAMLDGGLQVRPDYIEVLRKLAPLDVLMLERLALQGAIDEPTDEDEIISAEALVGRNCVVRFSTPRDEYHYYDESHQEHYYKSKYYLTPFGRGLVAACTMD